MSASLRTLSFDYQGLRSFRVNNPFPQPADFIRTADNRVCPCKVAVQVIDRLPASHAHPVILHYNTEEGETFLIHIDKRIDP
jgi:hypothetical protein